MILTHGANSLPKGDGTTVTIGGRDYPIVKIGNQLWMAENLDWLYPGLELSTGAWSSAIAYTKTAKYYNDDPAYTAYDGSPIGLYYTAKAITSLDSVLTDGWHVPTMAEIDALLSSAGTTIAEQYEALFALNPYLHAMTSSDHPGTNLLGLNLHLNGKLDQTSFVDLSTTLGLPSKDITSTDYITYKRISYASSDTNSNWANSFTVRLVKNL